MVQHLYYYFDDSGVLHNNSKEEYFVYAGYVFIGRENRDKASRKYKSLIRNIRNKTGMEVELKASKLIRLPN